jgi:hypothetical protein
MNSKMFFEALLAGKIRSADGAKVLLNIKMN